VVTRAAAILLLNSLCLGRSCVRPAVARRISARLSDGARRPLRGIPMYGSTGMGDVVPLAHLTFDLMIAEVYTEHQATSTTLLVVVPTSFSTTIQLFY